MQTFLGTQCLGRGPHWGADSLHPRQAVLMPRVAGRTESLGLQSPLAILSFRLYTPHPGTGAPQA